MPRLAALIAACLLATSCAGASSEATRTADATARPQEVTPARTLAGQPMRECFVGASLARCGSLSVPVDPTDAGSRQISVNVAVIPAAADATTPAALFLLAGGPGNAATDSFSWATKAFAGLRATRDFVLVDQRGTAASDALTLPLRPDVSGLSDAERATALEEWASDGFARLPADAGFYTTRAYADDLDAVRRALGYRQIDIYGGSYGATVAQYYLRQHADAVRSVVLDGATLLDIPIFERMPASLQRALDLMFARCEADPSCRTAYPALRFEFAMLESRIGGSPVTVSVRGHEITVDRDRLGEVVHAALMSDSTTAELPYLIDAAYFGRWNDVFSARSLAAPDGGRELAMRLVIRCSEPWARYLPLETMRLGAGTFDVDFLASEATLQQEVCDHVPRGFVGVDDASPGRSDVPVLVLVGEADPQDPPENVADVMTHYTRSATVIVPGHGHGVAAVGCVGSIVTAFVRAATTDRLDASCVTNGGAPLTAFKLP